MKKTKIVATLGPASSDKATLTEMINSGMNVARINFSHGSHEDHLKVLKVLRELNKEMGKNIAILGDLQGPKLRVGEVQDNGVEIKTGDTIIITTKSMVGTAKKVSTTYSSFPQDVKAGEAVLLDDGKLHMEVIKSNGKDEVELRIKHGGILRSKKGINLPNTVISLPSLTEKDLIDLDFALDHDFDWIGLSFVRNARDIIELKHLIKKREKESLVVAKIEKPEAIADIHDIVLQTDALMVARGDLGVEIPMEQVPGTQKMLISLCRTNAKPVIVATQMMETMIDNITPTRAEVNDVANAVFDGADAVMLSGETSVGKYPVQVIQAMCSILQEVEKSDMIYFHETIPAEEDQDRFITDSICYNACRLAKRVKAKAIITMTHSGYTGFKLSSQRPNAEVFIFTGNPKIMNLVNLVWGTKAFYYDKMVSTDHTIADIKYMLKKEGYIKTGDFVINIASMPINEMGMTNMLKLSKV